jgi:mannose-6-phosphate isomerase-like protein (cupin superfamily)
LPALDKNARRQAWIDAVEHLIPVAPSQDFWCEVIRKDDYFQQMLVVTRVDVPEEDHEDYLESFFILEGHCECTVGDKRFKLGAGDFLEIPLHVKHNVNVTSPYVVAILQYQFI